MQKSETMMNEMRQQDSMRHSMDDFDTTSQPPLHWTSYISPCEIAMSRLIRTKAEMVVYMIQRRLGVSTLATILGRIVATYAPIAVQRTGNAAMEDSLGQGLDASMEEEDAEKQEESAKVGGGRLSTRQFMRLVRRASPASELKYFEKCV